MSVPITKHNFLVRSARDLFHVIPTAFRIAASGRPGPVLIDVPKDVQSEEVDFEDWPAPGGTDPPPPIDMKDLGTAAHLINAASRPVFLLGGGVHHRSRSVIRHFMESAGIPAASTLMGLSAVFSDQPLVLGLLGMHGAAYANLAFEECDLVIAAGVRFNDRTTGRLNDFCSQAKIIHIDIDRSEIGKLCKAYLGLVGDVGQALESLLPLVEAKLASSWIKRIAELKKPSFTTILGAGRFAFATRPDSSGCRLPG